MVRIKMKATGGPFMWKKLGLPRPVPSDSDDEAQDALPPATASAETPPATSTGTGRTDSPAVQIYRRQKKRPRTPPSTLAPTAGPEGKKFPETTTPTGHSQKRPRTQSPPRFEPEPEPTIAKDTDAPTDSTSDVPNDVPNAVPSHMPSNVLSDVPTDTLSDMPSNLPRPTHPDHIVKALTFNKISERTRLLKISSLPYHPGKYIHHATLGALKLHSQEFAIAMGCECPQSTWDFPAEFDQNSAYLELSPVTPRHERVFRRKKVTISTSTQQPASTTEPVNEATQAIGQGPANEPPPAAPQQDAPQPHEDEAPNQTVEARLSRIED
ncbi:cell surface glycoprotein 1-like [Manihot esculenta]|uniref:cell surface glycoprotein 1-like n=1 Tax=Manihot esculenta TaxID=3983 RepID=UPI001CC37608|nr:cell surface glycoprotein 1-like [Manihot esculenta]